MKTIDVAAAVIKQGAKLLATQRGHGDLAGGWEFPGGKIEPGETPEEALVREIREELGATITVDAPIAVIDCDYESFHLHMYCFLCHVTSGEIVLHEHRAAKWLDASTIDSVEWLPADEEVIQVVKSQRLLDQQ